MAAQVALLLVVAVAVAAVFLRAHFPYPLFQHHHIQLA
jgi:hypothetical protein